LDGFKFRRQHPIGDFVVDFLRAGKSLIVEVDGGQHQTAIEYDDWRTGILCGLGYRVLRFWNNQVFGELDAVKETIHAKLLEGERPSP
jgi:very-short-patch-repair endonuclease